MAGYMALELLYFRLSFFFFFFRGNKVISLRASKPTLSFLELPLWFDVWAALCVVVKDGIFMAQRGHKHSSPPRATLEL